MNLNIYRCKGCGFDTSLLAQCPCEEAKLSRARMWQMMLDQIPLTHRTIGRGLNRDQPSTRDLDHAFNRFNF